MAALTGIVNYISSIIEMTGIFYAMALDQTEPG
jgi:hypothetical protein